MKHRHKDIRKEKEKEKQWPQKQTQLSEASEIKADIYIKHLKKKKKEENDIWGKKVK